MAKKISLSKIPQWYDKSAVDKNFKAKPISKKPKTTFTEFNHPPDFGSEVNQLGKMANMVNKSANDNEKPNMATIGVKRSVSMETNRVPIRGPVHENETSDKVNAIKNRPTKPV